jgi:hypothetical protein
MSDCFFSQKTPIEVDVNVDYSTIEKELTATLHKIAEARFDGQNAKYVNDLQPELDFDRDEILVNNYYTNAITNIIRRIEPYVAGYEQPTPEPTPDPQPDPKSDNETRSDELYPTDYVLHLRFPYNWSTNQEAGLKLKIKEYIVHYIIAQWLEKVSMSDTAYSMDKANKLLRDIKGICELRKCRVHRVWNGTY